MICKHCGEDKPQTDFYRDKSKPSGFKPRCKPCDALSRDKKKRAAYEKQYWSGDRAERRKAITKKAMDKRKDKTKAKRADYLKTDQGLSNHRKHSQSLRARKLGVFVEHVDPLKIYNIQGGVCYICNKPMAFKDTEMDHVIPLSNKGTHCEANVKIACPTCNKKKGTRSLEEMSLSNG